jgi:NADH dehydrogenase
VDVVYHLVSAERRGGRADLLKVDIQGTQTLVRACADAGVKRIFYVSRLGADRASAYPVLKAKAIAENHIRQSGVPYTILRSAVAFGSDDWFTTSLARMAYSLPFLFPIPGDGTSLLQPLWVEDLVTCLTWALEDGGSLNQTYTIGGSEALQFREILKMVLDTAGIRRTVFPLTPAWLRIGTVLFESGNPNYPLSVFWLDDLAADRTCPLDTIPRVFGLMPSRFSQRLSHLQGVKWAGYHKNRSRRRMNTV